MVILRLNMLNCYLWKSSAKPKREGQTTKLQKCREVYGEIPYSVGQGPCYTG